jgi:serine protease inhibitor
VDFASDTATQMIDAWVRVQTRDRIDKLFDDLDPDTRLVLANAVYLKADWVHPFVRESVRDLPFTLHSGEEVPVPTMGQLLESARHAAGDGWQAVELAYVGDTLAMWVIVPNRGTAPREVLTTATLEAITGGLQRGAVELRLPRWDLDTDIPLIPALQALGMHAPFDPGRADFTGIADTGLWISDAIYRATITVDEWGTEAAAVTGIGFNDSGPPPPDAVIHADRPFAFVIVDTQAHTPLFLGQVADPRS